MLRKLLLLIALLVLVGIGLVWTHVIDVGWNDQAQAPEMRVNPVEVGTTNSTVTVPVVTTQERQVQRPTLRVNDGSNQAAPPAAPPAPANGQ
jgi:hypothetical protein